MGFWQKIDDYLKYRGIPRKDLALGIGVDVQTLNRAIQRDSKPYLTEGLRACKYLKVEVDDFLDEPINLDNKTEAESEKEIKNQIQLYRKYHDLIEYCEEVPDYISNALKQMAQNLADSTPEYKSHKQ